MTDKDIAKIYADMESYLIKNIKRNLLNENISFHLKEEKKLNFKWESWQTIKLKELKRFRKENKIIINEYLEGIDDKVKDVLSRENQHGKKVIFINYKNLIPNSYNNIKVKDSFFKINSKKVNALIKSINDDFKEANKAVFRMSNDSYRQIINEASLYVANGVMTENEALNKAITDFEIRGINCIEYKNGSRHRISDYAQMAIRTASTRAYMMGEGESRKKLGITTIRISKHGTACKLCQAWENKILIDDVYSGGKPSDGNYPLLSEAMKQGLFHPNCRHGHGTYFPELEENYNNDKC